MIAVKCPNCGAEGVCMSVKIGEEEVWLDACYHCGTRLLDENHNVIKTEKKNEKKSEN